MAEKDIHRIAVLTSGGDAPGMNAVVRAVVRMACANGIEVLGINRGYSGLINNDFRKLTARSVDGLLQRGGTVLYTARCAEMMTAEGQQRAADNCRYLGIDGLVCCGGDGTYRGALSLARLGVPCIGIPGTIDNDIACTESTIGYDTAMNTVVDLVDRLNDTSQSHHRCTVVEVMGRHAGHMALNTGIACGAVAIVTEETPMDINEICARIFHAMECGKHHFIIVVSEGVGETEKMARDIQNLTGIDTRSSILGHVQRGGSPSLRDRVMASQMGNYAVHLLKDGIGNRVVAMQGGKIVDFDIQEALQMKKGLDMDLYHVMEEIT